MNDVGTKSSGNVRNRKWDAFQTIDYLSPVQFLQAMCKALNFYTSYLL